MKQIDTLIDDLRKKQKAELVEQEKIKRRLELRKVTALKRIGAAGVKHLGFGNNVKAQRIVEKLLEEASNARVSQAEAMADLAERGDLISEIEWVEIRPEQDRSVILWKGYCLKRVDDRYRFRIDGARAALVVREMAEGGYVAALTCRHEMASGIGEEAEDAAKRAYTAFCDLTGRSASEIPFTTTKLDSDHVAS